MSNIEYQQHIVEEYESYLKRCVKNHVGNFVLTPADLAQALLRAFEKGAAKGVMYESINDIDRISYQTGKGKQTETKNNGQTSRPYNLTQNEEEALSALLSSLFGAYRRNDNDFNPHRF